MDNYVRVRISQSRSKCETLHRGELNGWRVAVDRDRVKRASEFVLGESNLYPLKTMLPQPKDTWKPSTVRYAVWHHRQSHLVAMNFIVLPNIRRMKFKIGVVVDPIKPTQHRIIVNRSGFSNCDRLEPTTWSDSSL